MFCLNPKAPPNQLARFVPLSGRICSQPNAIGPKFINMQPVRAAAFNSKLEREILFCPKLPFCRITAGIPHPCTASPRCLRTRVCLYESRFSRTRSRILPTLFFLTKHHRCYLKMASLQFPPSSPVHDGPESAHVDPFPFKHPSKPSQRGRSELPTPNPSSTVGRSSSPARNDDAHAAYLIQKVEQVAAAAAACRTVSINTEFNIVNPHASVLRVPLLPSKKSVTIGRSSKACDFHFSRTKGPLDRFISRCHVRVDYSDEEISLLCLGHNGFGIIIPQVCDVTKVDKSHFQLRKAATPLATPGTASISKTIHLDYQHTEFHVARNERVSMPRFQNILLQVGSHMLLVNSDDQDEEVTDEEGEPNIISNPQKLLTPENLLTHTPKTPKKIQLRFASEEPTPSKASRTNLDLSEDKENHGAEKQARKKAATPLAKRSTNTPEPAPIKRRAQSEEPPTKRSKKEAEYDAHGKLVIDEGCIAEIGNMKEIQNILVNHLAFSRVSSTPASFLNTILMAVSNLSLQQLRAILHNLKCIGVIYRQGKDAAGKPLQEEYYYIPEKDDDPERNKLVLLIKGHGGLRACRKTHKQYFWKKPASIKK